MNEIYRFSFLSLALLINALVASTVAVFIWRRRSAPGAKYIAILMADIAVTSFAYLFENAAVPIPTKILWSKIAYLGLYASPPLLFLFIMEYSGRENWATRRNLIFLWAMPVVTVLLAATNEWHSLIWSSVIPNPDTTLNLAIYNHGAWFWIGIAYVYLVVGATSVMFVQAIFRYRRLYRQQSITLLTSMLVIISGDIIYVSGLIPVPGFDLTPFTFSLGGTILAWQIQRQTFINLAPIARDRVIETMADSLIVLDSSGKILDYNPAAERLISSLQIRSFRFQSQLLGQSLDEVLGLPELAAHFGAPEDYRFESVFKYDPQQRVIDLQISPLTNKRAQLRGHIATLRDITAYRELVDSERTARQMAEAQREIGAVLSSTLDFNRILHLILEHISRVITFDGACIWMMEEDKVVLKITEGLKELETRIGAKLPIVGSPFERALTSRQPLNFANLPLEYGSFCTLTENPFHSLLIIPLYSREQIIGFLSLESGEINYFKPQDKETAALFATQVAIAIENAQLYTQTQRQLVEQSIVNEIISNIATVLELDELLPLIHHQIQRFLTVPMFMIVSYEPSRNQWKIIYLDDVDDHDAVIPDGYSDQQGVTGIILQHNLPVLLNNPEEITRLHKEYEQQMLGIQPVSMMGIPLVLHRKVIGAMVTQHYEKENFFTQENFSLFKTIGAQISLALERVKLYEDMKQMAITDALTGLYNYRYFSAVAGKEFERALRYHKPLTVMLIDLDRFKRVNDTYGHLAGDHVLQVFSKNISGALRSIDIVARYGGEEFVIIFPETGMEEAKRIARRLHTQVSNTPIESESGIIHITASMGLAGVDANLFTLRQVIDCADKALYAAKNAGRDRVYAAAPGGKDFYEI